MIRRLFVIPAVVALMVTSAPRGFSQSPALTYPPAPQPPADHIVVPPQVNEYFYMRPDGQPFVLNQDLTVNFTNQLNRYYFNPHWRGEEWAPYQNWWVGERQARLMSTYEEFDNFSVFRFLQPTNKIHKFFERSSGFGP